MGYHWPDLPLYIIPDPDEEDGTVAILAPRTDQSNINMQQPDILGSDSEEDEEQFF